LSEQSFENFEVVVSDQTKNKLMHEAVARFQNQLDIKLLDGSETTGASENFNFAISGGTGEIVKIMCQDDIILDKDALQKISDSFKETSTGWVVGGCNHFQKTGVYFYNFVPKYNPEIIIGKNTLSSPSNVAFRRSAEAQFDVNLDNFLDVDFYYQLKEIFGLPMIIDEPLISNRIHPVQLSARINKKIIRKEFRYVLSKYPLLHKELGIFPIVKQYLRYFFLK
jgi:hypothetical protein